MKTQKNFLKLIGVLFISILVVQPAEAHSWHHKKSQHYRYDRHHDNHHDRDYDRHRQSHYPPYGKICVSIPGHITVIIGGLRYYYAEGVYYRRGHRGYEVVEPPCQVSRSF